MSALYVSRNLGGELLSPGNVVFENVQFLTGGLSYNPVNGNVTLNDPGIYKVQWWVAIQDSPADSGISFAISSSQGDYIPGQSDEKLGQITGMGLIEVFEGPVDVVLSYETSRPAYLAERLDVKGALMVTSEPVAAFGSRFNFNGNLELFPDGPIGVPLPFNTGIFRNVTMDPDNAITIQLPGSYRIDAAFSGTSSGNAVLTLSVAINGTPEPALEQSLECTSDTTVTFSFFNYLNLSAGDMLTLQLSSDTETNFVSLAALSAMLSVQRVFGL
ncbi:MAG: hypothetical protein ACOYI3_07800 [Christensenellales bacterium]|jgi:hypothetical protein